MHCVGMIRMSSLPFRLASSRRYLHRMGCFSRYATGWWFLGSPVDYWQRVLRLLSKILADGSKFSNIQRKKVPKDP